MKNKLIAGVTMVLAVAVLATSQAFAFINDDIQLRNNSVGIAVSPASSDRLDFKPGDSYNGSFRVRQIGRDTNEVFAEVTPYSAGDSDDYENSNFYNPGAHTEITNWITLDLDQCDTTSRQNGKIYFTMRPKEECYVKYHIDVPADAKGGSQHASIFVQSVIKNGQGSGAGIESSYRMGYLVYADIDGPAAQYSGRIIENDIPWLFFDPPLFVTNSVENNGNADFDVKYNVEAKNALAGGDVFSYDKEKIVLSESTRADKITWEGSPFFGIFEVTQKITFLNEESTVTKMVFIVPIWLIIVVVIVVALLIWAFVLKVRGNRRYRQR